jgi:preprotein translocase subunit SecG
LKDLLTFVRVLHWLITIGLIGTVMLQPSRNAGLGAVGGGGESPAARKARGREAFFGKVTVYLAIAFVVTSISLTVLRR